MILMKTIGALVLSAPSHHLGFICSAMNCVAPGSIAQLVTLNSRKAMMSKAIAEQLSIFDQTQAIATTDPLPHELLSLTPVTDGAIGWAYSKDRHAMQIMIKIMDSQLPANVKRHVTSVLQRRRDEAKPIIERSTRQTAITRNQPAIFEPIA
jgi:hypothetical protein